VKKKNVVERQKTWHTEINRKNRVKEENKKKKKRYKLENEAA
jgi:hypothetical protein